MEREQYLISLAVIKTHRKEGNDGAAFNLLVNVIEQLVDDMAEIQVEMQPDEEDYNGN